MENLIGKTVKATKMSSDSFYQEVIGVVTDVRNNFAMIYTSDVKSKWSNEFKQHNCSTSAKISNLIIL